MGQVLEDCETTSCLRQRLGPPDEVLNNGREGEVWIYKGSNPNQYSKFWVKNGAITSYYAMGYLKKETNKTADIIIWGAFITFISVLLVSAASL